MTLIEIRAYRNAWKAFEAPGVEPVCLAKDNAISYAQNRAYLRKREIRVLDLSGNVERGIPLIRNFFIRRHAVFMTLVFMVMTLVLTVMLSFYSRVALCPFWLSCA